MLTSVFGISIKYEAWNHQDSLPVYIAGSYDFHTAYIGNRRCIMLAPTEELATLPALKKQIVKIQQIDNVPVVFELTTVSNYRRKSLIENNIPFITDKQVFLPFIGTMLSDEKEPQKLTGKFVYSTQQLFLFYLYSKKKRLYTSEAGKVLPFTAMTLTRAVKQLETTDLFLVAKDGVNKFIESKYKRDELFEKAKVYLTTPVRKTGYIDKTQVTENMVFAGETALSEKSMLNPSRVVTYAISEKDYDKALLTDELIDPDKQVRLELWAYNPKQFSEDNSADDISIVLSFADTNDERIEEAVDELQERRLKEYAQRVKQLSADEIYRHSAETAAKESLLSALIHDSYELDDDDLDLILKPKNPVEALYQFLTSDKTDLSSESSISSILSEYNAQCQERDLTLGEEVTMC